MDAFDLADRLRVSTGTGPADQWRFLASLSQAEREAADDIMADGIRELAGHAETPHFATTVCDACGPLRSRASFRAPVYHPAEASAWL